MKYKNLLWLVCGALISALSYNIFFVPYNIIPGNIGGIGIIFKKVFDLDIMWTIGLLSIMCWLIGIIFLDKKEIIKSLWVLLLFPILVYGTSFLLTYVNVTISDNLLSSVVGGMSLGFGVGLVARNGYYITGYDIIVRVMEKEFKLNATLLMYIVNLVILLIGAYFFDFEIFIYSSISFVSFMLVLDKVILGIDSNKSFYIITTKPKQIKKFILDDLKHGVTELKGHGAYSDDEKYILFVSIPTRDYYKLRDGLNKLEVNSGLGKEKCYSAFSLCNFQCYCSD